METALTILIWMIIGAVGLWILSVVFFGAIALLVAFFGSTNDPYVSYRPKKRKRNNGR